MSILARSFAVALVAGGVVTPVLPAVVPPIGVEQRTLVMPKLPAGAESPPMLPADGDIAMPFVSGGAPGVASRINLAVWREMLDGASPPAGPGKTFTPRPDKLPQGISSLSYAARMIPTTSPRLLSLEFSGEGCGAYCEEYRQTRTFDLRDGRELSLGDLLTIDGFAAIGKRVDAERHRAYQAQVRQLRAGLKSAPKGKKKAEDDDADRLKLNEDCLQQALADPATPQRLVDDELSLDGHGGLVLTEGRCSNHAMRALDDVDQIRIAIPAAELRGWLTPYGLGVVQQQGDAAPPPPLAGRDLHGRLAGMAITMRLDAPRDGADTHGSYQYDKFHAPIALAVHQAGDTLGAIEQADSRGEFELRPAGGSLVGTWQGKEHRKRLPVILQ